MKEINKQLADKLMKVKGETRGFNLEHDAKWIFKEKGAQGIKKIESELKKLGYPIEYKKLKIMGFYPAGLRAISLLTIKKVFKLDNREVKKLCAFHPKISLVVRLFIQHFYSFSKAMEAAPKMWGKYWSEGELIPIEFDEKKKFAVLRIKNFDLHPVFCGPCLEGYFATMGKMIVGAKQVYCKETKCTFKGDTYHEYRITWK
ncbi:MAG: hypothetical protein ISS87_01820 [Candidatus Pacebacteria bacterium]|nr:hypothetical protein [Candidatus Paceibacterota bacterium]